MYIVCFGTRPEIIKLYPIIQELKERKISYKTLYTGQHIDLELQKLIPTFNYKLNVMKINQSISDLVAKILENSNNILKKIKNKIKGIIVQGDTATSYAIALSGFFNKIKIIHIEAGLRTYNKYEPFPEEINRKMISVIADFHFTPSIISKNNLLNENIVTNVYNVGNTIIDSLRLMNIKSTKTNNVIITLHRRENKDNFMKLFDEIDKIAKQYVSLRFNVIKHHSIPKVLYDRFTQKNIIIIEPLIYIKFLKLLSKVLFIISDSGGIQEEVTFFRKKILICRNYTERQEIITSGFGKLVNCNNMCEHIRWAMSPLTVKCSNIYGDGYASVKIIDILEKDNK